MYESAKIRLLERLLRARDWAVVPVDVENDFCPGGALAVPDGNLVIEPINRVIACAQKLKVPCFKSRDWHPPATDHFIKWPVHCVRGTFGAEFHKDFDPAGTCLVVSKGESDKDDGYSAFEGRLVLNNEPFHSWLQQERVKVLIVGGLATDYCVMATVLDALFNGYIVILLTDAIRAVNVNSDDGERALRRMQDAGAILATSDQVICAAA